MWNKGRRQQQTPTFLEGTAGLYVRRESPPRVPNAAPPLRSTVSPSPSKPPSTSASSATSATAGNVRRTPLQHQSSTTSASSAVSAAVGGSRSAAPVPEARRLSHTPGLGRTKPSRPSNRHDLSSHSFSTPRSHLSHLDGRKTLTTSLSIGNVVQHGIEDTNLIAAPIVERNASASLQSLPGKLMGSSILHDGASLGAPEEELPLPPNWDIEVTPEGYRYYVDHNNRRTHWIHPLAIENLPPGWTKIFDPQHGVVYYNEMTKRSQFEHPGLATPITHAHIPTIHESASVMSMAHAAQELQQQQQQRRSYEQQIPLQQPQQQQHMHSSKVDVEDLNIITEEIPDWLRLYSEAPSQSDHLLNWKLFKLPQLQKYDEMLMKLFKQEAINIVIKYERPRREINWELARRQSFH